MRDAEESAGLPRNPEDSHDCLSFWRGALLGLILSAIGWVILIAALLSLWG